MELLVISGDDHPGHRDGDIIDMRPDGFNWGDLEQEDPLFDIIRVPDAEVADVVITDLPDPDDTPEDPRPPLANCAWRVRGNSLRKKNAGPKNAKGRRPVREKAMRRVSKAPVNQRVPRAPRAPLGGRPAGYGPPRPRKSRGL